MLGDLRDIVLIIWGFIGIAATLLIVFLAVFLFRKVSPIVDSVRGITKDVRSTTSRISSVVEVISGARRGLNWIRGRSRRKGESSGGK